jgi:serine/threonine protein phosphatase PrpC/translation elongation factor EF-1beta
LKLIMDIKPWCSDTNLDQLEQILHKKNIDGLCWSELKRESLPRGISKLVATLTVDERFSDDIPQWVAKELSDYVQSVDIVKQQRIEDDRNNSHLKPYFQLEGSNSHLCFAAYGIKGFRATMEDKAVAKCVSDDVSHFALFDGHGGSECAQYLAEKWITELEHLGEVIYSSDKSIEDLFLDLDVMFEQKQKEKYGSISLQNNLGSTAIGLTVRKNKDNCQLICSNCGDSRCIFWNGKSLEALSKDHKPTNSEEQKRIESSNGFVVRGRVLGELAVSRCFGDYYFKPYQASDQRHQMVIAVPDIQRRTIPIHRTDITQVALLACDGLWDVLTNEEAMQFILSRINKQPKASNLRDIAKELCEYCCVEKHSTDNISVIIIQFY